jgi:hypothetical protein
MNIRRLVVIGLAMLMPVLAGASPANVPPDTSLHSQNSPAETPAQQEPPPPSESEEPEVVVPPAEEEQPSPEKEAATNAVPPSGTDTSMTSVEPQQSPPPEPVLPRRGVDEEREEREIFPRLDLYLPEGEVNLRARKLIRNVLFESQVNYKFADGDISTFLRYKYYARDYTYKLGVFDTIEFEALEEVNRDFDRVRGGLLLVEYPTRYNRRYLGLIQVDGLTFGDVDRPENNRNNVYAKLAWQQGTTFDERINSIAGESRGRIPPILTAFRDIGPQKLGLAAAITQSIESIGSDFNYTKVEAEGLKRLDLTETTFVVSRLHVGSFLTKDRVADDPEIPEDQSYSIPRYELFKIGGRDAMKGVDDRNRGTDEIHLSNEFFFPIFRNRDYRTWRIHWNNLYGITYVGGGNVGFDKGVFTDFGDYVFDAGLGFEASATVRDFEVFISAVYAQTIEARPELEGNEIRLSVRTSR